MFSFDLSEETIVLNLREQRRAEIYTFGALLNRYEIMQPDGTWFNAIKGHQKPLLHPQTSQISRGISVSLWAPEDVVRKVSSTPKTPLPG